MHHRRASLIFTGLVLLGCTWETFVTSPAPPVCEVCLLGLETLAAAESPPKTPLQEQTTATIEGRVIYEADKNRPWRYGRYYIQNRKNGYLAEAVVALRGNTLKNLPAPATLSTWDMDQKDVRFTPETLAIRAGDRVKFTNSDPQVHNINANSPLARFDQTIRGDQETLQTFDRAGGVSKPVILGCKLHSTMRAWVFVFDHPFFQLTAAEGKFRFENVPPGEYKLEMAHPAGELKRTHSITVKPGEQLQLDIRVSPDQRVKS